MSKRKPIKLLKVKRNIYFKFFNYFKIKKLKNKNNFKKFKSENFLNHLLNLEEIFCKLNFSIILKSKN